MSTEMRRWNADVGDLSWQRKAACATDIVDAAVWHLFDPVDTEAEAKEDAWERAAEAIEGWCQFCPVMLRCRGYAALHRWEGVWGGQFRERRGIIDLDTGMVWRDEYELPEDEDDPLEDDGCDEPAPVELDPVLVEFGWEPRKRGLPHFVFYSRDELAAA